MVCEVAGTTRDVLVEPMAIDGAEVMLVDLAGATTTDDDDSAINRDMQAAARCALDRAELVIECVPARGHKSPVAPKSPVAQGRLLVRTKADQGGGACDHLDHLDHMDHMDHLTVSAIEGTGLDTLRRTIARHVGDRAVSLAADALALHPRHEAALRSARHNLDEAVHLVDPARRHLEQPELVASAMRGALDDLATLAGDITPDDILGRVFATFCVGK